MQLHMTLIFWNHTKYSISTNKYPIKTVARDSTFFKCSRKDSTQCRLDKTFLGISGPLGSVKRDILRISPTIRWEKVIS